MQRNGSRRTLDMISKSKSDDFALRVLEKHRLGFTFDLGGSGSA